MEVLKFDLSGQTAFFKKPDVNTFIYFTYGNIHKIAIIGILGSCLGLKGYNQQSKDDIYPEFYDKLKELKISIVPKNKSGYITKKIQVFNNSVGYASKEEGGNLIVKEQWLENPRWEIYIMIEDNDICKMIKNNFLNYKFTYIPYLGKNDHMANISNIELVRAKKIECSVFLNKIDSMFILDDFAFSKDVDEYDFNNLEEQIENELFKYQERLPYRLEPITNQYIVENFIYTNMKVTKLNNKTDIYIIDNLNICFV